MSYLYDDGGRSLGWFTQTEIREMKNHITAAVYAFAFLDEKPSDKVLPYELEDTFYIGMSGGTSFEYTYDSNKKEYFTGFAYRQKYHWRNLTKINDTFDEKYRGFHDYYLPKINPHKTIFMNVCVPGNSILSQNVRGYLSVVEQEFIYLYQRRWSKPPLLNLAENTTRNTGIPSSKSGQLRDFGIKNNLNEFLS
jgi:hypothetical protein